MSKRTQAHHEFLDFNWKRLQSSLMELFNIYRRLRSSRFWWPGFIVLTVILSSFVVNIMTLLKDQALVLVEGENPIRANFETVVTENDEFVSNRSLELLADVLPKDQTYFSLMYEFDIKKDGSYWILFGGTPPGSYDESSPWNWFSPYWISIDGGPFTHMTESVIEKITPEQSVKSAEYIKGGYHWTRIGSHFFQKGKHKIEIRVSERRKRDGKYALFLDAFFLAPEGWKPLRSFSHMSRRLFIKPTEDITLP